MSRLPAKFKRVGMGSTGVFAVVLAITVPVVAQASVVETFQWVPDVENPATGFTTTPSGTLQLTLSSFSLTGTSNPPNFGPYYASGANAATANITGFSYTDANGVTVGLSNVTTKSVTSTTTPWDTSGLVAPAPGKGDPFPSPTVGYYLISGFTLSGSMAGGATFMVANNVGTAGATYVNGVPNGDATFNATAGHAATEDGGYWKLVTPVPLPAALPLVLSGLGGLGLGFARRSKAVQA